MAKVTVNQTDIEKLSQKLVNLAGLTQPEEALLWALFAVAADVVNPATGQFGHTDLVSQNAGGLSVDLTVAVPVFQADIRSGEVPARMAAAFVSGAAPAVTPPERGKITKSPVELQLKL